MLCLMLQLEYVWLLPLTDIRHSALCTMRRKIFGCRSENCENVRMRVLRDPVRKSSKFSHSESIRMGKLSTFAAEHDALMLYLSETMVDSYRHLARIRYHMHTIPVSFRTHSISLHPRIQYAFRSPSAPSSCLSS